MKGLQFIWLNAIVRILQHFTTFDIDLFIAFVYRDSLQLAKYFRDKSPINKKGYIYLVTLSSTCCLLVNTKDCSL